MKHVHSGPTSKDCPKCKEDKKVDTGWVVKRRLEPKTATQKLWWTAGANDVIRALEEWAKVEAAKDRKKKK